MIGKSCRPVIEILTGSLVSGQADATTSPRGLKSFDLGLGGVGLGIVAALGGDGNEILANKALFSRKLSRSNPIPVQNSRRCLDLEETEEYTIVACRGGPNKSYTKVYLQGSLKSQGTSVFHISPARSAEATSIPAPDFLSSCNLCHKKLHGKDIYMYRGEKAFCSKECRYRQIVMDERAEKCSSEASRPADMVGSPYANGQIFTTGILAT